MSVMSCCAARQTAAAHAICNTAVSKYLCSSPLLQVPDTVDAALRDAHHEGKGGITFEEFEKMMLTAKDDDLDLYESRLRPDSR